MEDNAWLNSLYKDRQWCMPVFVKDTFFIDHTDKMPSVRTSFRGNPKLHQLSSLPDRSDLDCRRCRLAPSPPPRNYPDTATPPPLNCPDVATSLALPDAAKKVNKPTNEMMTPRGACEWGLYFAAWSLNQKENDHKAYSCPEGSICDWDSFIR
ncbi:hypothetical protein QJS04_geneDACA014397 [Acorus gramineus]|uniref:Uncharacterized protein n=1 Tax=Acorus gramineus TaxID=55184 RepID=A0AAV8ZY84_ACOGR|nr:hypothetical protein QJS04_geneDACA014397 [Acorus gramineus]